MTDFLSNVHHGSDGAGELDGKVLITQCNNTDNKLGPYTRALKWLQPNFLFVFYADKILGHLNAIFFVYTYILKTLNNKNYVKL